MGSADFSKSDRIWLREFALRAESRSADVGPARAISRVIHFLLVDSAFLVNSALLWLPRDDCSRVLPLLFVRRETSSINNCSDAKTLFEVMTEIGSIGNTASDTDKPNG